MTVSSSVCTYEQSVSILVAGIEKKTLWYWCKLKDGTTKLAPKEYLKQAAEQSTAIYPAYTGAELLEILPDQVCIYKDKGCYCCSVHKLRFPLPNMGEGEFFIIKSEHSMANALAAMIVYLRKHQLA